MSRPASLKDEWFEPFAVVEDYEFAPANERDPMEMSHEIESRIRERLGGRIRELHVAFDGEVITLRGKCQTYHSKQLAQHAAQGVIEDEVLHNVIEVCT